MADEQKKITLEITEQTYNVIMNILRRLVINEPFLALKELQEKEQERLAQSQVKVTEQGD